MVPLCLKENHYFLVHKCIQFLHSTLLLCMPCLWAIISIEYTHKYRHTSMWGMPMCVYVEYNMHLFVPCWRFCKHCCSLHSIRHAITSCTHFLPHTHFMFVCEKKTNCIYKLYNARTASSTTVSTTISWSSLVTIKCYTLAMNSILRITVFFIHFLLLCFLFFCNLTTRLYIFYCISDSSTRQYTYIHVTINDYICNCILDLY